MTAPRIDVVRKQLNAYITELASALEHLDDLHAIGWYRHADQRARERVATSRHTFTLDNNGDPRARAAYEQLATGIITAHRAAHDAIVGAMEIFDTGEVRQRRDQTADINARELISALARQAKRTVTGEHHSPRTTDQPLTGQARRLLDTDRLTTELEDLRSAVRKSGIRPERSRFSPRELAAWQAASNTNGKRKRAHSR